MEWKNQNIIDYSSGGDDIDSFALKTKATFEQIFELIDILRTGNAAAGLDASDTVPYMIRINTKDGCLYVRDAKDEEWIYLGQLAKNFGITPKTIKAVENGGNIGKMTAGLDANKPTSNNQTNDFFFAHDTSTVYRWTGSNWQVFMSLNFKDLLNYEKYCVKKEEVAYSGVDKILRLDKVTGKGNINITGSPDKLLNYEIDVQDLKDGDVLTFDLSKQKIVNKPKDELKKTDTTYTAEADKLLKVGTDKKIHVDVEGSASKIDGVKVDTEGAVDGQVLMFENGSLVPVNKDTFVETDTTTIGAANKLVKVHADGTIHASLTGSASQISGLSVDSNNIKDGQVFKYDGKRKMLVPADKDVFTNNDVTTIGEANKLVKVHTDSTIHATLSGSASHVDGIKVNSNKISNGQVLVYDEATKSLKPANKDVFTKADVTTTGEANKLVQVHQDKTIHANLTGSASQINGANIKISNLSDGDVLVFHSSTRTFRNEQKNTVGTGKSLILMDGNKHLVDYNGSKTSTVDIRDVIGKSSTSFINHLLRLVENLYVSMDKSGLNAGSDGIMSTTFSEDLRNIDQTSVIVSSVVQGDDSLDVLSTDNLLIGAHYYLADDENIEPVQIKDIKVVGDIKRVILTKIVSKAFTPNQTKLCRSNISIVNGKLEGSNMVCVTKPILFADAINGKKLLKTQAHLVVKHKIIEGSRIKVEIALRRSRNEEETFVEMTQGKTYPDGNDYKHGSTEYTYSVKELDEAGCIATLRLTSNNPVSIDSFVVIFNE